MEKAHYLPTESHNFYKVIESKKCTRVDSSQILSQGIYFESIYFDGDKEIGKINSITFFNKSYAKDSKVIIFWLCKGD